MDRITVTLTVESSRLNNPRQVAEKVERVLNNSPDLIAKVVEFGRHADMTFIGAMHNTIKKFEGTPFEFGFAMHNGIAFGIGWGQAVLRMVYIDFYQSTVEFSKTYASRQRDKRICKPYKSFKELFRILPKTAYAFDKAMEGDES